MIYAYLMAAYWLTVMFLAACIAFGLVLASILLAMLAFLIVFAMWRTNPGR